MFHGFKSLALVAGVIVALAGSTNAAGAINYVQNESLELPSGVFSNPPALVFSQSDGKYEAQKDKTYSTSLRLKAEKKWNARITEWELAEIKTGAVLNSNGFQQASIKKLDKSVTYNIGWDQLKHFESKGRALCEQHGKPNEKVVKTSANIRFEFKAIVRARTNNASDVKVLKKFLPIHVVCMPEPFEVKDVQLSVQYEGNSRDCPVKATLKAKFTTNKPGKNKFTFLLVRDNGMKQEVNAETFGSGAQSIALWHKNYTFTKTESRKYMIVVIGHKATALWVPVRANCSSGPAGGFSNGPIPTN